MGQFKRLGATVAVLIGAGSLVLADHQIGHGRFVFYPPEIVLYLALIILVAWPGGYQRLKNGFFSWPRGLKWAAALVLVTGVMATLISPLWPHSLGAFKSWIVTPLLAALFVSAFNQQERRWFYNLVLATGLIVSVGVLVKFSAVHPTARLSGWYSSPNIAAELIGPILAIGYVLWRNRRLNAMLGLIILLVMSLALLATQSVGGLLAVAVVIVGFELTRRTNQSNRAYYLGAIALAVVGFVILSSRLSHSNNSLDSRTQIWHTAWRIVEIWPVTGVGLRGFEHYYPILLPQIYPHPLDWSAPEPHNLILSWWVSLGLFGMLALLYTLWLVWKSQRLNNPAWWALLAVFVHGLIDTPYWRVDLVILFWIYLMLVLLPPDENVAEQV